MSAREYWNNLYRDRTTDCVSRITDVCTDFLGELPKHIVASQIFNKGQGLIELGCGTGGMGILEKKRDPRIRYLGVDISDFSIQYAIEHYADEYNKYYCGDINDITDQFDVCFTANTLEHFKDPYVVIDKLLSICKHLFILVPYNQPNTDGYDVEGGAGHVFTFTPQSFDNYNVVEHYTYFTHTWVQGADPKQLLIVLEA